MLIVFRLNDLVRARTGERDDERRCARRDRDAWRRVIFRTIGVDLGDRRLETVGDMEGTKGTAVLGGGGD
jgi:hypothetical protein